MNAVKQKDSKRTDDPIKLLVYPLASDNPYQLLLYKALRDNYPIAIKMLAMHKTLLGFLFEIFVISFQLIFSRMQGYRIIHLHWLYQLGFPGKPVWPWLSRFITSLQINLFLFECKVLQYKIIWTVHDVVPHYTMSLNDRLMSQKFLNRSDKLIALSSATIDKLAEHGLIYDYSKITIVPHGNYIGSYLNIASRADSRQKLNIDNNAFVYLFFGTVLSYKNASGMLLAFESIIKKHSDAIIIIAGKASDTKEREAIQSAKKKLHDNLRLHLEFIPDDEVQLYFNASDIVVFPYLRITNSGTALLAASFAKPVIAPKLGAFNDLPAESGVFYKAGEQVALESAMYQAIQLRLKLDQMSIAAYTYAQSLSWNSIANQTYQLYKEVAD